MKSLVALKELQECKDLLISLRTIRRMITRGDLERGTDYKRVGSGRGMIYLTESGLGKVKSGT